ncbi:Uu.00g126340.m01.CDS01 [Anthostomella pinea]|uniref:Uu.00g126340.m01.CDS01 n=1 Tax=Anthostomella pinea TaxID=933095 RepID=A0AAI8VHY2_9PEZI|nr:Uu.00g126340.m01.CDS01 [Anthostomella pinea]
MRIQLHHAVILIGLSVSWLSATGVWGQRLRLEAEPTYPSLVDGHTKASEGSCVPDEAMTEETVSSAVPAAAAAPSNTAWTPPAAAVGEEVDRIVPISAILFAGSPGPKDCRGTPLVNVALPKPGSAHTTPTCYNVPGVAQCGNFVANQSDGCEARVFSEPNCLTFSNVAAFTPEKKAFGGYIRSVEIACGIVGEAPAPLNLPGLKLPPDAQQAFG